ncbi:flagellar basal body M-ring protein FliF [Parasulfuritortus cantonensis]|uniref:Flagellar M-ring protein n=1 Tax=Parasulfuritortus cantonensis TaxID=2528202 RepID=A0A4R1BGD4_9PROT|nr:flagellar basal-body MS-ring/collar protein FliF [Parasulfuritortus cantonensis]TCJ16285.1 flagellar basal body M-ring protein FliF [Parasulfuritortus cantonensis]
MATPQEQFPSNPLQRFNALPGSRKMGVVVALAATIALLVGAVLWSRTPDYRVLFSGLSERDAGSVVATLQQMNVPYKTEAGGAIMVPSDQVYDVRFKLASQGLPRGGSVGFELMDNPKLGMTQFQEQVTYQRALEGELARTIQTLAPVEAARVHLAIPKPSVFIREQQKPSASVLVNLYAGRTLDTNQVGAIAHLVSSSVPDLAADHVTVVDQAGNMLTSRSDSASLRGLSSSQFDYVRELEGYYAQRIEAIVVPIVGANNVKAEVRADLDFSEDESTSESYKPNPSPETQAVRSQQSSQESGGGGNQAGGIPGALSNQPPGPATAPLTAPTGANAGAAGGANAAAGAGGSSRRDSVTNFELDKTIRHVRESLGRIKRLSAAVVVNYRASNEPDAKPTPIPAQELDQINNLVKEALGYNQARGDTVNVVNAAFTEAKAEEVEAPVWKDPDNISLAKELLKNLLIFGLAFYLVFGVLRPLLRDLVRVPETLPGEGHGGAGAGLDEDYGDTMAPEVRSQVDAYQHNLNSVRDFSKQNPKIVAEVVKEWMAKE